MGNSFSDSTRWTLEWFVSGCGALKSLCREEFKFLRSLEAISKQVTNNFKLNFWIAELSDDVTFHNFIWLSFFLSSSSSIYVMWISLFIFFYSRRMQGILLLRCPLRDRKSHFSIKIHLLSHSAAADAYRTHLHTAIQSKTCELINKYSRITT